MAHNYLKSLCLLLIHIDGENDVQKVNRMIISNNKSTYEFIAKIEMTANDLSYLALPLL